MRIRLKGLNSKTVRLASGRVETYHYACKGGPRLPGKPGSPEFVAGYNEAIGRKRLPPAGTLFSILQAYQASSEFRDLAPRTRADYVKQIRTIETEFIDFPLAALSDRRSRGEFLAWRDRLATASRRQADYAFTVLARLLSWAENRGLVTVNPLTRSGRLYRAAQSDKVWTEADEAAFRNVASEPRSPRSRDIRPTTCARSRRSRWLILAEGGKSAYRSTQESCRRCSVASAPGGD